MAGDPRDILELLRAELAFAEGGGYRDPQHAKWRPLFVFQDSPTCFNYNPGKPRRPCSECALMRFVPDYAAAATAPCRFIPLNERGETVDSLYRTASPEELERALCSWLKGTITRLENEQQTAAPSVEPTEIHVKARATPAG